jgi:hypothetical protein
MLHCRNSAKPVTASPLCSHHAARFGRPNASIGKRRNNKINLDSQLMSSTLPLRSSRRQFLGMGAALGASALAGCVSVPQVQMPGLRPSRAPAAREPDLGGYEQMYAARIDEGYELPAIPVAKIAPRFRRQIVADPTGEPAGTIVVDTANHFLYLVRAAMAKRSATASALAAPASNGPDAP